MTSHSLRLAFPFVVCALLPAQQFAAPTVSELFTPVASLAPNRFGFQNVQYFKGVPGTLPGTVDATVSGQQTWSSPVTAGYFAIDEANNQVVRQPWLDGILAGGNRDFVLSVDRLSVVDYGGSGGLWLSRRANHSVPFSGRTRITGLPAGNLHSPQLVDLNGQPTLVVCRAGAGSTVIACAIDLQSGTASSLRSFGPVLGGPGNEFEGAIALVDPRTFAFIGWVVIERQYLSGRQRVYFTSSLSGAGPWQPVSDGPLENILAGVCQMTGGVLLFPCLGQQPISQFNDSMVRLQINAIGERRVPASGGILETSLAGPVTAPVAQAAIGFMGIGMPLPTRVSPPGITGDLVLGQFQLLDAKAIPHDQGITSWTVPYPALAIGSSFTMQGGRFEPSTGRFFLSGSALVQFQ